MANTDKIQWSMRIRAAMCGKMLTSGLELACIGDSDFLRLFEMCQIYLHQDDFPLAQSRSLAAGYGLRAAYEGDLLVLVADYELGALSQFLDATKKALKNLYLSPVIAAVEWDVFEGVIRIRKAAVPCVMVRTSKSYAEAKKAEMLPVGDLAL